MMEEPRRFKLVVLGTTGVGKTCLTLRFAKGVFDEDQLATIGAAYMTKRLVLDQKQENGTNNDKVKKQEYIAEIWDTAGQERYEAITPLYYRSSEAAIIVFDLTSKHSFEKAKEWLERLRKERPDPNMPIVLTGNKADAHESFKKKMAELESSDSNFQLDVDLVDDAAVEQFVREKKLKYFKTSAKTGLNVVELFNYLALHLPAKAEEQTSTSALGSTSTTPLQDNCC